jgi:hypothetical protein
MMGINLTVIPIIEELFQALVLESFDHELIVTCNVSRYKEKPEKLKNFGNYPAEIMIVIPLKARGQSSKGKLP